MAYIY